MSSTRDRTTPSRLQAKSQVVGHVLEAYGWGGASVAPLGDGLINQTLVVRDADRQPLAVLQRLHPVFGPEVNLDLEAVTDQLAARGLETPRLIRTKDGEPWVISDGCWRAISYVAGRTTSRVTEPAQARAAGELVARFHDALSEFRYEYRFARAGVRDTRAHLERLREAVAAGSGPDGADGEDDDGVRREQLARARALGTEILAQAARLPELSELPRRHTHGDLKISNVLFAPSSWRAICLIDLDTCGRLTIAHELGDALRSWCNPHGEDVETPSFDLAILAAAARGYARGAPHLLSADEIDSIVTGAETSCVELAARFCADVFADSYFGWDATRFASRGAHNLVRATGQLVLARALARGRAEAERIVRAAFAGDASPRGGWRGG